MTIECTRCGRKKEAAGGKGRQKIAYCNECRSEHEPPVLFIPRKPASDIVVGRVLAQRQMAAR